MIRPKAELANLLGVGYADGLQGGMVIGLPPVMNFGSPDLRQKIVGPVLAGEKYISLAISEAFAGSVSTHMEAYRGDGLIILRPFRMSLVLDAQLPRLQMVSTTLSMARRNGSQVCAMSFAGV